MRLVPVVCCLLLVFAGCQSGSSMPDTTVELPTETTVEPTTLQPTTTTQTAEPSATTSRVREIDVEGGTLPYDANTVWTRVESMLGVDVGAPLTVRVENLPASEREPSRFHRLLGVPADRVPLAGVTPLDAGGNEVVLNGSALDRPHALEGTLAHEYVHVVQMRQNALRTMTSSLERPLEQDELAVIKAIQEGSAQYVDREYGERYMTNASEGYGTWYRNSETLTKLFLGSYYFGARYVNATIDSPRTLEQVYENPPRTTEELVHALEPGSEPVANLSVTVVTDRQNRTEGRLGELFVRTTLATSVNETTAARAADGWGNDQRVAIGTGDETEYAWVLRWDDAANATEFERGIDAYLDSKGGLNASVRVDRVAPETTVLFVGSESFVADASVDGTNGTVTIRT